jgi:hypothetical protein
VVSKGFGAVGQEAACSADPIVDHGPAAIWKLVSFLVRSRGICSDYPAVCEIALAEATSTCFLTILPQYDPKMVGLAGLSAPHVNFLTALCLKSMNRRSSACNQCPTEAQLNLREAPSLARN